MQNNKRNSENKKMKDILNIYTLDGKVPLGNASLWNTTYFDDVCSEYYTHIDYCWC